MGYKLDFTVEKQYIDHDQDGKPYYDEAIEVSGNGVTDSVILKQDASVVALSLSQFMELMEGFRNSSLWCQVEDHFKYQDSKDN